MHFGQYTVYSAKKGNYEFQQICGVKCSVFSENAEGNGDFLGPDMRYS